MFGFFKKKKKLLNWEPQLIIEVLKCFENNDYLHYINSIKDGILEDVRINENFKNFYTFKYNNILLNKYEILKQKEIEIVDISVFNNKNSKYESFKLRLGYGLVLGYEISDRENFYPNFEKIDISRSFKKEVANEDFNDIKKLFSKQELDLLNPNDVYLLEINDLKIYHLFDIEDGNFIGVDKNKSVYRITHDPKEVILLNETILDLLDKSQSY